MLYYVVMCMPVGNSEIEAEYTGEYYSSREEARKEYLQAKNDINVECAWIEKRSKDFNIVYDGE